MVTEPAGEPVAHACFPGSGVASVIAQGRDGRRIELGLFGRDGMTGLAVALGSDRSPHETVFQIPGTGHRVEAGALRKAMPVTFLTFTMGYLAIIGVPPFSGFWSKDKIIETALAESWVVGLLAVLGAGITGFYMTRLMLMTFFGEKRWEDGVHPHESPKVMTMS